MKLTNCQRLRRVRNAAGAPTWLWGAAGDWLDLGAAGLGDNLEEAAAFLLTPDLFTDLLAAAPALKGEADEWQLLQPGHPGKALAIGKNFLAHARESGDQAPDELVWFAKLPGCLSGPGCEVQIPAWLDSRVDHEAEVVLLVGAPLHNADLEGAAAAIAAYTLGNDITARKQQGLDRKRAWPWLRSKNIAGFGPFGPEWTPASSISNLSQLELRGYVGDELRQQASLADLLWEPANALVEISRWCPLNPGDIVFMGTPAGVGPIQDGDLLRVEVDQLGCLHNPVRKLEN